MIHVLHTKLVRTPDLEIEYPICNQRHYEYENGKRYIDNSISTNRNNMHCVHRVTKVHVCSENLCTTTTVSNY